MTYELPDLYNIHPDKYKVLIGKTITAARQLSFEDKDDCGFLRLDFSDGTHIVIEGGYGGYTGDSNDEYLTLIGIASKSREAKLVEMDKGYYSAENTKKRGDTE